MIMIKLNKNLSSTNSSKEKTWKDKCICEFSRPLWDTIKFLEGLIEFRKAANLCLKSTIVKGLKSRIKKNTGVKIQNQWGTKAQLSSPSGIIQILFKSPSSKVWQHDGALPTKGSSWEPWCPGINWGSVTLT